MDGGGWSVGTPEAAAEHNNAWPHDPLKLFVNFGTKALTPANGSTEVRLAHARDATRCLYCTAL